MMPIVLMEKEISLVNSFEYQVRLIINAKLGGFVNYFVFLGVHTAS